MIFGATTEQALQVAIKHLAKFTGQEAQAVRENILDIAARRNCRNNPGFQNATDGATKFAARTICTAFSCLKCGSVYAVRPGEKEDWAERMANDCCSPYVCTKCDKVFDDRCRYLHCPNCRAVAAAEQWKALPVAESGEMIHADAIDRWFYDLSDFLDYCFDEQIDPDDLRPIWANRASVHVPNLAESLSDEAPEDFDFSFLDDLQAQLETLVAQECKWFEPYGKTRPAIPGEFRAELAAEVAKEAAGQAP